MAPPWAIAREYRGLHTGWETARGTVLKAAQCRPLAKRQDSQDFSRHHDWIFGIFRPVGWSSADDPG
jgi:hypothetical protein